jgi:uncharacterized protein YegL
MGLFSKKPDQTIDDRMVSLVKTAGVSLQKRGLTDLKAAVYLVLDHSGSMHPLYENGSVQHLAEQALGLAANLDDDGTVPVVLFNWQAYTPHEVVIGDHAGAVDKIRKRVRAEWGSTNYAAALHKVIDHIRDNVPEGTPSLVLFQTDGQPDSEVQAEAFIRASAELPVFWQFIGFGRHDSHQFEFLRGLSGLSGRTLDNAGFYATGNKPKQVADADLYDGILNEFPSWLQAAKTAGIL